MAYPLFSEIDDRIYNNIITSGGGRDVDITQASSNRFPWVRLISAAKLGSKNNGGVTPNGYGLIMYSNPDIPFFTNYLEYDTVSKKTNYVLGTPSYYGGQKTAGMLGFDFGGNGIYPYETPWTGDLVLRPSPLIQSLEIKEGKDQISRHCTIIIKCFSLAQVELLQAYLMEPGYTLFVEYGWNSDAGLNAMISTKTAADIIDGATEIGLNYNNLHIQRVKGDGDYDAFYGFIVGGSLTSEGDKFNLKINLRGTPGLPVWLQGQHTVLKLKDDSSGIKQIESVPSSLTYSVTDIASGGSGTDGAGLVSSRRYRWMFNKLPGNRQTPEVQKLCEKLYKDDVYGYWDFINFDYAIQRASADFLAGSFVNDVKDLFGEKQFNIGGLQIPKDKLVSKNKYIQFGLALDILNCNNGLFAYKYGNKSVNVRINPKGFIGAFPGIFSTNPKKLIIPGKIPDFYKFFCNPAPVSIEEILKQPFIDNSLWGKTYVTQKDGTSKMDWTWMSFVQESDLNSGYNEIANYYGRLEFLYINFDIFVDALKNSSNKSIKDVLIEICNELSSAANSFWNLQIIEVPSDDEVVLQIVDENWRGYLKNKKSVVKNFYHSGEQSNFIEANLEIDIPSEMTNQIVLKREDYTSNPNSMGLDMGGLFSPSGSKDMFFKEIDYRKTVYSKTATPPANGAPPPKASKAELETQYNTLVKSLKVDGYGDGYSSVKNYRNAKNELVMQISYSGGVKVNTEYFPATAEGAQLQKLDEEIKLRGNEEATVAETALSTNLEKIDIVPNPYAGVDYPFDASSLDPSKSNFDKFNKSFKIYCCEDQQLFDIIKNNAFEKYGGIEKTSHPLPIKYTFKILGKSGIRRGDTFNIIGIPKKYRDYGFFQVTEIEQSIENNNWYTTITGQYFQQIKSQ